LDFRVELFQKQVFKVVSTVKTQGSHVFSDEKKVNELQKKEDIAMMASETVSFFLINVII
jgi:hypothetical protein